MINFLAELFNTDPAVVWVALFAIGLFILFKIAGLTRRGPEYAYSGNRVIDAINKALVDFKFLEDMGNIGKKVFRNAGQRILEGKGGFQDILVILLVLVLVSGVIYSAVDHFGAINPPPAVATEDETWVVGEDETCVRNGVEVPKYENKQAWDVCNGQTIMPTTTPPATVAPTLTSTIPAPTTQVVVAQATPTIAPTQEPVTFVILPIMFSGQLTTEYGFRVEGSTGGHHKLEGQDQKCAYDPYLNFEVPQGTKTAFLLYEGDREEGYFATKPTLSDARYNVSFLTEGNTFKVHLCYPVGGWFSLWVND